MRAKTSGQLGTRIMAMTFERNKEVEAAPLNEEAILLDPTSSQFFMLNSTSAFIWDQLSTPATIERIATAVVDTFADVTHETATTDVSTTLEELVSKNLVIATGDA
jgi:hypothetical protein